MKKRAAILLSLLLLLTAGCARQEPTATAEATTETVTQPTTIPTETTAPPTVPLPQTEEAIILADHVPAVLAILPRGDIVDMVGEYDEKCYVIKTDSGYGLVEKQLLATPGEEAFEAWTGYSYWNRNVYDNYRLTGSPIQVLTTNSKIEVLDKLDNCYIVRVGDITGFMRLYDISKNIIQSQGDAGGGSSGGSSGSGGGQDGGDISLQFSGSIKFLSAITQEGSVSGQATVKADGTEVVLGYFERGESAQALAEPGFTEDWDGYVTVAMGSFYVHIPETLVQRKGEESYVQWDGFAKYNAMFYDNFYLQGEGTQLSTNTAIHVVADLETCYLTTVEDAYGYIAKDMVSENRIVTGGAPSDSDGGSSGGQEWSDPVL